MPAGSLGSKCTIYYQIYEIVPSFSQSLLHHYGAIVDVSVKRQSENTKLCKTVGYDNSLFYDHDNTFIILHHIEYKYDKISYKTQHLHIVEEWSFLTFPQPSDKGLTWGG